MAAVNATETGEFIRLNSESRAISSAVEVPPEKVWSVLPRVYQKFGIETEVSEASTRTIGTRAFTKPNLGGRRTSEWVRCGNEGAGPSSGGMWRMRLSIMSTAKARSTDETELVTTIDGTATRVEGTSTGAVICTSTGALEAAIRDLVVAEVTK